MESGNLPAATTSRNADLKTTIHQNDKRTTDSLSAILQTLKIDSPSWRWDRKAAKSTCASEVVFSQENSTVIFHPSYSFGTAAVFGDKPLESKLVSYWEVILPRCYGTSMMLGLGTRRAKTHSPTRFEHLLRSKYSCGLAHNGYLYRGDSKVDLPTQFCAPFPQDKQVVVGMMFHGPHKWLAYFLDGKPLGVAFTGLDMAGEQLFPMVSSTAQKSQFTLGRQCSSEWPLYSLSSICIKKICECIDEDTSKIAQLNIPEVLANSLYNSICSRQDFHRRKKKKPKKKPGPTTTSSSIGRKRKGGMVHSTIIQQFDDELEMGRLSRLVVSGRCQLLQSILNGRSSSSAEMSDVRSVDQKILKRTRV